MKFVILLIISIINVIKCLWHIDTPPLLLVTPCPDNNNISLMYVYGRSPEEENQYKVKFDINLPSYSEVGVTFDSEATVKLEPPSNKAARVKVSGNTFFIKYFKEAESALNFIVSGSRIGIIPYITSWFVNGEVYCNNATTGYFDELVIGYKDTASARILEPDGSCGRRKIKHTELIVNGLDTKPGDWPWHVSLFKYDKRMATYICGGTLLAKFWVLTAAHCVTVRGVPVLPESVSVILGKYNLIGLDTSTQEKEVYEIIAHKEFMYQRLQNDIALLKLKTEAIFDDYVQPACIWHEKIPEKLPSPKIHGTVVGWGTDETDKLSTELRQATMPLVTEATCIKSNPLLYSKILDDEKFCAGFKNGTSACNGDSGGGFHVFVPDNNGDDVSEASGAWYIRGIVSIGAARRNVALCDPKQYTVFTDVSKYNQWLSKYITIL